MGGDGEGKFASGEEDAGFFSGGEVEVFFEGREVGDAVAELPFPVFPLSGRHFRPVAGGETDKFLGVGAGESVRQVGPGGGTRRAGDGLGNHENCVTSKPTSRNCKRGGLFFGWQSRKCRGEYRFETVGMREFGLAFGVVGSCDVGTMVELEIYAAGLRAPEKMMALNLELESLPDLRCKVDTNHDLVYMEFGGILPSLHEVESIFKKAGLEPKFVGSLPEQFLSKKKTQRLDPVG